MELWIGSLNLGLLYAVMTLGVFITFRVYQFPDITVDGSFTTGAAVAGILLVHGVHPLPALMAGGLAGMAAGGITACIHTRLQVNGLLAGILVMTALYSINLHIMGRSNIPLNNKTTWVTLVQAWNPDLPPEIWNGILLTVVLSGFWGILALFFKTDLGLFMRATGSNPQMASAQGVAVDRMKIFGVALANGLVGLSGALVAQYQGFADIGMGIGTVVVGLAAVIIGESLFREGSVAVRLLSVIAGALLFRFMIAFALVMGMNPIDLKLLTAGFVLLTLVVSKGVDWRKRAQFKMPVWTRLQVLKDHPWFWGIVGPALVLAAGGWAWRSLLPDSPRESVLPSIGVVQLLDHGLLNTTRDSFLQEMACLGYVPEKTMRMHLANANGDMPTLNTILDDFLRRKVDLIVTISTGATQAAIQKIRDRPVVFATVANPFLIGAGTSPTDHLPNLTGVYGAVPMDRMLEVMQRILPGKRTFGSIWDPSQVNSVYNMELLQEQLKRHPEITFLGATVAGSSEVSQAAASLVAQGIDAFLLPTDNIVYSAFEAVVEAARPRRIPIICNDVERLPDGALGTLGYDYTSSGIQAAHLVDRILKGESPSHIPFERYTKVTFGLNQKVAHELGITLPRDLLAEADVVVGGEENRSERGRQPGGGTP